MYLAFWALIQELITSLKKSGERRMKFPLMILKKVRFKFSAPTTGAQQNLLKEDLQQEMRRTLT